LPASVIEAIYPPVQRMTLSAPGPAAVASARSEDGGDVTAV